MSLLEEEERYMRSRVAEHMAARPFLGFVSLCAALAAMLTFVSSADAVPVLKFKEAFGSVAQPAFSSATSLAVDQSSGDLLVMDRGAGTISRFKPDGTPDNFSALGTNVIEETGGTEPQKLSFPSAGESQIAVDNSGTVTDGDIYVTLGTSNAIAIFARSGEYLGQLAQAGLAPFQEACGVAAGPGGELFVGDYEGGIDKFVPTANPPVNTDFVRNFKEANHPPCNLSVGVGPSAGSLFALDYLAELRKLNATTGAFQYTVHKPNGMNSITTAVDPSIGSVLVGAANTVVEYDASAASEAVELSRLNIATTVTGLATGPSGVVYVAHEGAIEVLEHVHTPTVASAPVEPSPAGATLNGSVNPESVPVTECKFEYGLANAPGLSNQVPCNPEAAAIPPDSAVHAVNAVITGLQRNTTYRFRLVATNINGVSSTAVKSFTTSGVPEFTELRARDAGQTSAVIEGKVNPRGFATSYHFEWGPTAAYGHRIPALVDSSAGAGSSPVLASAELVGLAPGNTYHYRLVASNAEGSTASSDKEVETLNSCGLPDQRCLELVSPREVGPVSQPGLTSNEEFHFQAAASSGSLIYSVANGLPGTTKAAQVLYQATRGAGGWSSAQFSPPIIDRSETQGNSSRTVVTLGLSEDLSCGVLVSNQKLTADPSTRLVVEAGGSNLYRRNPGGTYTAISNLPPENLSEVSDILGQEYDVAGISRACDEVIFSSGFRYPGVPGVSSLSTHNILYEWRAGTLHSVGWVPAEPSGETQVAASPGGDGNTTNAVSEDGSRVFFTAERKASANPAEIGQKGIFVRENGTVTRDISKSETATADTGATYQYATADGSRVFFTANTGLTAESSLEGQDLYEYDLKTNELTDLSVTAESGGAEVVGVLGTSTDGAHVYFAAKGQLLPGKGSTSAENAAEHTLSIYGEVDGTLSYVGPAQAGEPLEGLTSQSTSVQTSRVSPNGRYLLFQTRQNATDYNSEGAMEAYLYDSLAATEQTVCVSCRQTGSGSLSPPQNWPLGHGDRSNQFHPKRLLTDRQGQPVVTFTSLDYLATGAVAGQTNLYEWTHGQVFFLATEPSNLSVIEQGHAREYIDFAGASADGTDLYFATPASLNWEDGDDRWSVYDVRAGGGFAPPPAPDAPCNPVLEGSCDGPSTAASSAQSVGTTTFTGPGNKKPKKHHKKKHHKKKHHKKKSSNKKKASGKSSKGKQGSNRNHRGRHAGNDRRAEK